MKQIQSLSQQQEEYICLEDFHNHTQLLFKMTYEDGTVLYLNLNYCTKTSHCQPVKTPKQTEPTFLISVLCRAVVVGIHNCMLVCLRYCTAMHAVVNLYKKCRRLWRFMAFCLAGSRQTIKPWLMHYWWVINPCFGEWWIGGVIGFLNEGGAAGVWIGSGI